MHTYIEDFLDDVKASKSESTYYNRKGDLKRYDAWLDENDLEPTEVHHRDIHRFFREEGKQYAGSTMKVRFASVKLFYDFLSGVWDVMDENLFEDLKRSEYTNGNGDGRKHQEGSVIYVTPEEIDLMCEHASPPRLRNELLIRLLFQTGLRRSEASIIEIENVDRDERAIEIWSPKTETRRTVFYQPSLDFLMNQWLDGGYRDALYPAEDSPYLFVSEKSEQMSGNLINEVVKDSAQNFNDADGEKEIQEVLYEDASGRKHYRITAHAVRHGHAVAALKSGIDIRTVQMHMGHSDIETTMKYLRLIDEDVKESYRKFGSEDARA